MVILAATLPLIFAAATTQCRAVDGDTLRCGVERVRLIGIDAPEMAGHCPSWRRCAPGDPRASQGALAARVKGVKVRLVRYGQDHYGRTLAVVYAGGVNLACAQVSDGRAVYVARWDRGGVIARCAK